jgi:hypothetical protein
VTACPAETSETTACSAGTKNISTAPETLILKYLTLGAETNTLCYQLIRVNTRELAAEATKEKKGTQHL